MRSHIECLCEHVGGAEKIPHGIEEMAFDHYLREAGWKSIAPRVAFVLHRSLLLDDDRGQEGDDEEGPLSAVSTEPIGGPYARTVDRRVLNVEHVDPNVLLATCRHSRAFDCAGDSERALERAREEELAAEGWLVSGHPMIGRRILRSFEGSEVSLGTVTRWLPADDEGPALWHAEHDDDDEEDLEEDEVHEAVKAYDEYESRRLQQPIPSSVLGGPGLALAHAQCSRLARALSIGRRVATRAKHAHL